MPSSFCSVPRGGVRNNVKRRAPFFRQGAGEFFRLIDSRIGGLPPRFSARTLSRLSPRVFMSAASSDARYRRRRRAVFPFQRENDLFREVAFIFDQGGNI
jgi:hypothetical protein